MDVAGSLVLPTGAPPGLEAEASAFSAESFRLVPSLAPSPSLHEGRIRITRVERCVPPRVRIDAERPHAGR